MFLSSEEFLSFFFIFRLFCFNFKALSKLNKKNIITDDVQQALQNLDPTTDVAKRLSQYQAMTNQLGNVLLDSDKDPSKRRTFASEESKKEYLEGVFNKIQKGLPSALYAPDAYPYLYEVLKEALDAKMEDTRFNFSDIINEKL